LNLFNRFVIILVLAVTLAASAAWAVAALDATSRLMLAHYLPWTGSLVERLPARGPAAWNVALGSSLVGLVSLLLLLLELRPDRGPERVLLSDEPGGEVAVVLESIRKLVEHVAVRVPMVREARSRIVPTRRGLRVNCRLAIDPTASVPDLAREVQMRVGAAIEQHLGRPAGRVGVTTQITPLATSRRRRVL
jgi:hypothetical protein